MTLVGINGATTSKPHHEAAHHQQCSTHTVGPRRHDGAPTATHNSAQVVRCANSTNDGLWYRNAHTRVPGVGTHRIQHSTPPAIYNDGTTTTPHPPKSIPLEGEQTGQMSSSSKELTVRETDWPMNTSVSTRSALCTHPDRDAESMDPPRLSEDPGD